MLKTTISHKTQALDILYRCVCFNPLNIEEIKTTLLLKRYYFLIINLLVHNYVVRCPINKNATACDFLINNKKYVDFEKANMLWQNKK